MYTLEYHFSINDNRSIQITSKDFHLFAEGPIQCRLKPVENDKEKCMIKDSTRFFIECVGFQNEKDAYDFASKIIVLIKYYGFRNFIGVYDFKKTSKINSAFFEEKLGVNVIDKEAIMVYETGKRPLMFNSSAKFRVSHNNDEINLKNDMHLFANINLEEDPLLTDIFKYYSDSKVSKTLEISFLSMIFIVEKLISTLSEEEKQVDQEKIKLINVLMNYLDQNESMYGPEIKSSLGMMKKKSIIKQIKLLVDKYSVESEHLGLTAQVFLSECYQIRSNIVHTNSTDILTKTKLKKYNLGSIVSQLEILLINMVNKYVEDKYKVKK